jgi:aspartate aminotransferase
MLCRYWSARWLGLWPEGIINNMKAIVGHMGAWSPKAEQVAMAKYIIEDVQVNTYLDTFKIAYTGQP